MFINKLQRRSNGIISKLNSALRGSVDKMLLDGRPYREIVEFLGENDVELSQMAVSTYAKRFLATTQQLQMAQQNYKLLNEQIEMYPDLDTSEAIVRIVSNQMLNTLANTSPDDWQSIDLDKLLHEVNSLIRVTATKRRTDAQNKNDVDMILDDIVLASFEVMREDKAREFGRAIKELSRKKIAKKASELARTSGKKDKYRYREKSE